MRANPACDPRRHDLRVLSSHEVCDDDEWVQAQVTNAIRRVGMVVSFQSDAEGKTLPADAHDPSSGANMNRSIDGVQNSRASRAQTSMH